MEAMGRLWGAYVSKIVALRRKTMALASRWGQLSVQHDRATRVFKSVKILRVL